MSVDLTGGLDPAFERFLRLAPGDPDMRDSATLWIIDETGKLAFPRVTIDAIGGSWATPWVQMNFAHADGRRLRLWSQKPGCAGADDGEGSRMRTAGPLRFECVEPYRRWTMAFDGEAQASTVEQQLDGHPDGELQPLSFEFEAEMAAPPWLMGGMTAQAMESMRSGDARALMGGIRYEQLCRITGRVSVGQERYDVRGTGMRVRRQGVRRMGAAMGHLQLSALFPSGRAFGVNAFAPGAAGRSPFNEGFVYSGGGPKEAARLVEGPWMTRLAASGEDASLVLETPNGRIRIEGETLLTVFDHHLFEMAGTSILAPGIARFSWDGEEALGLIERCTLREDMKTGELL
jgi:hypothetical protein